MVPTHARPARLARLLDSLARQTMARARFEIVVVDDGSPAGRGPDEAWFDGTRRRLHRQANAGPAAARNAGAALARGALLAFVDDDCVAEPGWLDALHRAHLAHPGALLGGRTENGLPENPFSATSESLMHFFDAEARRDGGALDFLASNNLALARHAFEAIGGFDTAYPLAAGEDRDFCRRWARTGGALRRVPDATLHHFHALDLGGFWRQHTHYGRGAARFHATRADAHADARTDTRTDVRTDARADARTDARAGERRAAPGGFHARLLLHPLTARAGWPLGRRLAVSALVALSQLAIANGLLRERAAMRGARR